MRQACATPLDEPQRRVYTSWPRGLGPTCWR